MRLLTSRSGYAVVYALSSACVGIVLPSETIFGIKHPISVVFGILYSLGLYLGWLIDPDAFFAKVFGVIVYPIAAIFGVYIISLRYVWSRENRAGNAALALILLFFIVPRSWFYIPHIGTIPTYDQITSY